MTDKNINTFVRDNTQFAEASANDAKVTTVPYNEIAADRHEDSHIESPPSRTPFSARTTTGRPIHSLVGVDADKTVVTVDGIECLLSTAVSAGLMQPTAAGDFSPVTPKATSAPVVSADAKDFPMISTIGGKHRDHLANATGDFSKADSLMSRAIVAGVNQKGPDAQVFADIAGYMGSEKSAAVAIVNGVISDLAANTADALEKAFGVADGTECLNNYILSHPSEAANAMVNLYRGVSVREAKTILSRIAHTSRKG